MSSDLRARASRQQLEADFWVWLDGFSPNVQDILDSFEFRNQIPRLSKADGSERLSGLDNHGMGTIFDQSDALCLFYC